MIHKKQDRPEFNKIILFTITSVFIAFVICVIFLGISGCIVEPQDDFISYQKLYRPDEDCFL